MAAGVPRDAAFAEAGAVSARSLAYLGVVIALSLLGAFLAGHSFVYRPVRKVLGVIGRVAGGDLRARVGGGQGGGEIGQLAQAFDGMAESLLRREAEKKAAEDEVAAAKARLEHVLATSPAVLYSLKAGENFSVSFMSPNMKSQFGHDPEEFLEDPKFFPRRIHPDDAPGVSTGFSVLFEKGRHTLEYGFQHRDGSYRWVRDEMRLEGDRQGAPLEIIGSMTDITERRQAERALAESERRYRLLAENVTDVIWTMDMNLRFTYVSPSVARLRGYSPPEVMAQTLDKVLTPASLQETARVWAEELAREKRGENAPFHSRTMELEQTCKDGSTSWVECNMSFLRDAAGLPVGIMGISRDITERRKTQERLRASEEEARRSARESEIMAEIGRIVSSGLVIEEVYGRFAEQVGKVLPFDRISIAVADRKSGIFTIPYFFGRAVEERPEGGVFPLEGTPTGRMLETGTGMLIQGNEWKMKDAPMQGMELLSRAGFRSYMIVPLIAGKKVLGGLAFSSLKENAYREEDFAFAQRVGNQISGAIANARLYAEVQTARKEVARRALEKEVMAEIGRIVSLDLHIEENYEQFARAAGRLLSFDRVVVNYFDEKGDTIKILYASGAPLPGREAGTKHPLGGTVNQRILQRRESLLFQPETEEEWKRLLTECPSLHPSAKEGFFSILAVPLILQDRVIGSLIFISKKVRAYEEQDLSIAGQIGFQIAGAVSNAQLFVELRRAEKEVRESEAQARRLAEENRAVAEISRIVSSDLVIELVYGRFAEQVGKVLSFDRLSMAVIDRESGTLAMHYVFGRAIEGRPEGGIYPLAGTVIDKVAQAKTGMLIQGKAWEERIASFPDLDPIFQSGFRSCMIVPLSAGEKVLGALVVSSLKEMAYRQEDFAFAQRVGIQISGAVANALLYAEVQAARKEVDRRALEKEVMAEIGRIVSQDLRIEESYEQFARAASRLISFDRVVVNYFNEKEGTFKILYTSGAPLPGRETGTSYPLSGTVSEGIIQTREAFLLQPQTKEEWSRLLFKYPALHPMAKEGYASMLGVPLILQDRVIGSLFFFSKKAKSYGKQDLSPAAQIGFQIAGAVSNAQLFLKLQRAEKEVRESEAQARRLAEENRAVAEIGRIISSGPVIEEVYGRFAQQVGKVISIDRVAIAVVEPESGTFTIPYVFGRAAEDWPAGGVFPMAGTPLQRVAETKAGLLMQGKKLEESVLLFPGMGPLWRAGLRSYMIVPLIAEEKVLGCLAFSSVKEKAYRDEDFAFAQRVGHQIAGAIANARLYAEVQAARQEVDRRALEKEVMAEIGRIVSQDLHLEENYEQFARAASRLVSSDRLSVNYLDEERGMARILYASGDPLPGRETGTAHSLEGTASERVLLTRESLLLQPETAEEWGRLLARYPGFRPQSKAGYASILAVPLILQGRVIGTLFFHSKKPMAYGERDVSLAEQIGVQIAGAVANAQLFLKLKKAEKEIRESETQARRLAEENRAVAEIGRIVGSTLKIEEVYGRFSEEVSRLVPVDRISISLIAPDGKTASIAYVWGGEIGDRRTGEIVPLAGSPTEQILRTRSPLLFQPEDGEEIRRRFPELTSTFQAGFRSLLSVPLISKDRVVGALHLRSFRAGAYGPRDVNLAERVGRQIAGAIASARLFAERERAEKERVSLEEQLRQSQKMEAVGRLAGGIAHDLNNVLTVTKVSAQLSLMDLGEENPSAQKIREIDESVDRATNLIRQLLAFSRRQVMEMKVLDLNGVLRDMGKMLPRVLGEDVELKIFPGPDLGRFKGDRGQIEQVVMNLAVNARDAMPCGGRLTLETGNADLDEGYCREHAAASPGRYVMLSVSDNGAGMAPEVRERVFEPFFTTKETGKGTGLGLAVVYGIVKQSEGNIWVQSEPGKGTTFKIYFPRIEEEPEKAAPREAQAGLCRGRETVLVAEDEARVRQVAATLLRRQGYRVLEAASGQEALRVLETCPEPVHLLITDVVMPGMSGPDLARQASPRRPRMGLLYMSGYAEDTVVRRGILREGAHFLVKPFSVDSLSRKVREVLDRLGGRGAEGGPSPGEGSPPGEKGAPEAAGGSEQAVRAGGSQTVLLVEDEAKVRKAMAQILREQGCGVLAAGLGEEALRVCEKHPGPIHLLITNLAMPGMSGLELARRVAEKHPSAKALYMSFQPAAVIGRLDRLPPGANYLSKPFSAESLRAKVQEALVPEN